MLRLVQSQDMPPGAAALHCPGVPLNPDSIEFCIGQPLPGGGQQHLDPRDSEHPWGAAEFWQPPLAAEKNGDTLILSLDAFTTYHLTPNRPYLVSLRDAEGGRVNAPVIGIAMRLPSSPPKGWKPVTAAAPPPLPTPEPVAVEPPPIEVPVEPLTAGERPDTVSEPPPKRSALPLIAGLAVLVLALGGGAAWWFLGRDSAPQTAEAPATPLPAATPDRTLAAARAALAANPEPQAARELAEAHLAAKDLDGAFLLFRAAAEKGDKQAAIAVGGLYDPATWSKETSPLPAPNADQAVDWYKRAADAGDAEAQYRLGMVLKSGKTEAQDGPEQAVVWLKKAADQGHAKAKEALGQ